MLIWNIYYFVPIAGARENLIYCSACTAWCNYRIIEINFRAFWVCMLCNSLQNQNSAWRKRNKNYDTQSSAAYTLTTLAERMWCTKRIREEKKTETARSSVYISTADSVNKRIVLSCSFICAPEIRQWLLFSACERRSILFITNYLQKFGWPKSMRKNIF